MKNIFLILLTLSAVGCVSIQRDIYFRDNSSSEQKTIESSFPGHLASLKVSSPDKKEDVFLRIDSPNKTSGSYTFGILIPILPVFFLPGNEFSLNAKENLNLNCYVQSFSETVGRCQNLKIMTDDGRILTPLSKSEKSKNGFVVSNFIFGALAVEIKHFKIIDISFKFESGEEVVIKKTIDMSIEDWTRYNMWRIAP